MTAACDRWVGDLHLIEAGFTLVQRWPGAPRTAVRGGLRLPIPVACSCHPADCPPLTSIPVARREVAA